MGVPGPSQDDSEVTMMRRSVLLLVVFAMLTALTPPAPAGALPRPVASQETLATPGGPTPPSFAADQPSPRTLSAWRQLYHDVRQAEGGRYGWPDVASLRRAAARTVRTGVIPLAVLWDAGEEILAAAALADDTWRGRELRFELERIFFTETRPGNGPRLSVDFADGAGPRPLLAGTILPVAYSTPGLKIIQVSAAWPDGRIQRAAFPFMVHALSVPAPDDTLFLVGDIPYEGGYAGGQAYVYLAENHMSLTNPVIVIEGFDIDNSLNWDGLYERLNEQNLLESLRATGFDFVALNFDDSNDYIQRNAYLTVALLAQIRTMIPSWKRTVLVGASMGGLIGRYALAYMEHEGLDHGVATFISFDSPQRGANIPLGLQQWVDFFASESAEAAFLRDALDQPSPRQMLVYHYAASPPGGAASDPLRQELMDELAALGGYPHLCRNVAIANGSGAQVDQGYPAGAQVISYEYSSFLVDIVGNVWSVPDGTEQVIFDGLIDRIWPLPDDQRTVQVSGTQPYDTAPGGLRPSMVQLDTTTAPYGDIIALQDNHCFIPTISSLDLATTDLFHPVADDPDIMSLTAFDAIYYPQENELHNQVTPQNAVWFTDELLATFSDVAMQTGQTPEAGGGLNIHPNPFNPQARIGFALTGEQPVRIAVYDLTGRLVATLTNRVYGPGHHVEIWDGRDGAGKAAPSGAYLVQLQAGPLREARRVTLIR
jgi:hypothetical protein